MTRSTPDYTLARLMATVPGNIKPVHLVKERECLDNIIEIKCLPRLNMEFDDPSGTLAYRLVFGEDSLGTAIITGSIETEVMMECQRCMNPFPVPIRNDVKIGLAFDEEQLGSIPDRYEPMLVKNETISLLELIEEEVLLSVPMVPVHERGQCPSEKLVAEHSTEKVNPFAVLKTLKKS